MSKLNLIAGHSKNKAGAVVLINEATETIYLRDCIYAKLKRKDNVYLDGDFDSLNMVVNKINARSTKEDYTLSIHFNAFNGEANGSEIYVYHGCNSKTRSIATDILKSTCESLGTHNRGVFNENHGAHSRLAILNDTITNSMLLEVCFVDNKNDVNNYKKNLDKLVDGIAVILNKLME